MTVIQYIKQEITNEGTVILHQKARIATCKKCEHEWFYTGQREFASCPKCRTTITFQPKRAKNKNLQHADSTMFGGSCGQHAAVDAKTAALKEDDPGHG
jgi:hypothetical protein